MAIITDLSFLLENKGTLDAKQNFKTIAEMKAFDERFLSDTAVCTCDEDGSLYIFDAKNSDDPKTGKWRAVEGSVVDVVEKDNKTSVSSKGVYGELYTTVPKVPMYYKLAEKQDGSEGLVIVADGTASADTEVEEATVNANKADGDDTTYTVGQYVIKIDEVPEHDETTYMPRTETYTKTEVDEKIEANKGATTEEIKVVGVEGIGYEDGDVIPEGTLFMDIFKKALTRVIHPEYVAPTMTLKADKVLVEKGVATDILLTPTFTQNDAGAINGYKVFKDSVEIDNQVTTSAAAYTDASAVINAETTYKYEISYDETAVIKQNNLGVEDPIGKIEAGSIFKEVKVKPVLATYVGVVDNGNVDETNIVANCEKLIRENTTLVKKVSPVFQTVVFATTGTLTSIINQNNYEVLSSFTKTVVSIGGENYNVYALENINVNNFAYTFKF